MPSVHEILHNGHRDPLRWAKLLWPEVMFYDKQREIIYSVRDNYETFVVAGNMLGKDFVAGFIALWAFLTHHPCRVVTTSVKDDHLRVLWGEIGRFIQTSRLPLRVEDGGPLLVNHRELRKVYHDARCDISYCIGMVSERGEGMAGHHAAHTYGIIDEATGTDDITYTQMGTWANRMLGFGNANFTPPTHWFYKGVKEGDLVIPGAA
jgi:hypothetical protein